MAPVITPTPSSRRVLVLLLLTLTMPPALAANTDNVADVSMRQFLAKDDGLHQYRGMRRLEAENGTRSGWLEAITEYFPETGFHYQVTAEGGSSFVRDKVLRAVLNAERDFVARNQPGRFALARANYTFQPNGVADDGLAAILLSPKREDHVLIAGTMFLRPEDGDLVRLQGRLVKNPSFWVKSVDVTRHYERIPVTRGGVSIAGAEVVMPVVLESSAQLRLFGAATLRMTYSYSEIDGRPVAPTTLARR
jgi:hypothetical protein